MSYGSTDGTVLLSDRVNAFIGKLGGGMQRIFAAGAASTNRTRADVENDGRGQTTFGDAITRVSEPGGRGTVGTPGYVSAQTHYAERSDMSPTGVGGQTYLPWVGALVAAPLNVPGGDRLACFRRMDAGPGLQRGEHGGQPWETAPIWNHQSPASFWNIAVSGADSGSGWSDINAQAAPARIPHQFRPALRMNATLHSHGQGDVTGSLSGINATNAVRPPANLLGGNSVSRFPRSMRLPSGTGATTNGAGTSHVPAVFVPRGVQ